MSRRDLIRMTPEEVQAFLQQERTLQVATIDHDGYPHVVAMWYLLINNELAFWTYAKSQKAVNLRRDPRLTCLAETGERYDELRGVQIKGQATLHEEVEAVESFGTKLWERYMGPVNEFTQPMIAAQAKKRVLVVVTPVKTVSWDHRKLGGAY